MQMLRSTEQGKGIKIWTMELELLLKLFYLLIQKRFQQSPQSYEFLLDNPISQLSQMRLNPRN
jgi:hypothetical protein